MQIKDIHLVFHVLVTWFIREGVGKHLLVAYWGQNSSGGQGEKAEEDLATVCMKRKYDIIVIGFVVTFFGQNNKDQMPTVNFSLHCWEHVSTEYPNLYKCPKIEEGIKKCQAEGKKVLISLGGATGNNILTDDQAKVLAKNLFDLFLGGAGKENIRPFGSAVLDGIDLDIEDHKSGGYAQLVTSLRELEKSAGVKRSGKQYLITGAPQCPFPDASLGPKAGTALGDKGNEFDHVYVQFYNNFCHTGDEAQFYPNVEKWLNFAANAKQSRDILITLKNRKRSMGKGPKIFVGVPSATGGAGDPKFYRTPEEMEVIYEKLKDKPDFGGFMIWDAAWDQQNVFGGKTYSDKLAGIMSRSGQSPEVSTTPGGSTSPTSPVLPTSPIAPGSTPAGTPTPPSSAAPATPPTPSGGGGEDFCKGKDDGDYADPDNPNGYISCSGGITHKRPCPPNLVWNDEKKMCDWPTNRKYRPQNKGAYQPIINQVHDTQGSPPKFILIA